MEGCRKEGIIRIEIAQTGFGILKKLDKKIICVKM